MFPRYILLLGIFYSTLTPLKSDAGVFGDADASLDLVVVSNFWGGGTEHGLVRAVLLDTLRPLVANRERPSSDNKTVDVIFTGLPSGSKFSGNPKQLFASGEKVLEGLELPRKCEDLQRVFQHIKYRLDLEKPSTINLTLIAPGIDVAIGCTAKTKVIIPQDLPADLLLASILADERTVSFRALMVLPEQQQKLLEHIDSNEIARERREDGDLKVEIFTTETTGDAIRYWKPRTLPAATK